MEEKSYKTTKELLKRAKSSINIPFGEIDTTRRLQNCNNKGNIGQMFEECWFGLKVNSRAEADFKELGVELKVTPCIRNKSKKYVAKERLVLNIINYMTEIQKTFGTSSFWQKDNAILLMYYEYLKNVSISDFKIIGTILYEYPEKDLIIIRQDWLKIIQKIKDGKAHELSEGDTLYLGVCRKGAGGDKDLRKQPFNNIMAYQKAFCLKQSYMTHILNEYVLKKIPEESIITNTAVLQENSLEEYIIEKISPFFGKKQSDLILEFKLNPKMKNINERIIANILGIRGSIKKTEEFKKANIEPKTIRIRHNNTIKESMSFPNFKFKEIVEQEWEDSYMYNLFSQTKFMFIIFRFNKNNDLILENLKFWNMPVEDIEEVKKVWLETVNVIKDGIEITIKNGIEYSNLPGMTFNEVSHVRPHGQNKADCYEQPNGEPFTKQCFWLSNKYILKQISDT